MSRSGYSDDASAWDMIRWSGMVASATRGKRGQAMLKALLEALDAMPDKRLITDALEEGGEVCAMGALGRARGIDMDQIDPEDYNHVALTFGIASCLAREISAQNDEYGYWSRETPEMRWKRMRDWIATQIKPSTEDK